MATKTKPDETKRPKHGGRYCAAFTPQKRLHVFPKDPERSVLNLESSYSKKKFRSRAQNLVQKSSLPDKKIMLLELEIDLGSEGGGILLTSCDYR
jgi:hypothetical protein